MKALYALGILAAVAAISFETWKGVKRSDQRSQALDLRDSADNVMRGIRTRLRNPEDCTDILGGETIKPGESNEITLHYVPDPDAEPGAAAISSGSRVTQDGLRLVALSLEAEAEDDIRTEILDEHGVPTELRRYPARIKALFSDGAEPVELTESFLAWSTPPPPTGNGQIQACFTRNSPGALCNDLGGYFIPRGEPYGQSCRFSIKTLRRGSGKLAALANCRVAGVTETANDCSRYGFPFGAVQLNGRGNIVQKPGPMFLCQACQ